MKSVEELFEFFKKILQFFCEWPEPTRSATHLRLALLAFIFLKVFPAVLILLSFLQVENIENLTSSFVFTIGYFYIIFFDFYFWINRSKLEQTMKSVTESFNQNEDAAAFANEAIKNAKFVSQILMALTIFAANLVVIFTPAVFNFLPLPMYKPIVFIESSTFHVFYWILQIFSFNYAANICVKYGLMFILLILINGYAKYLGFKLRSQIGYQGMESHRQIVHCINIHKKLLE